MGRQAHIKEERGRLFRVLTLSEQAAVAEQHQLETLFYCPDRWAMQHQWVNRETGEVQRARCNRWECLYCGPRKVDLWRQLVKLAEPTLFLTLTKAGKTVAQARRALRTFMQALRRGSRGRGPNHKGARLAYHVEYFAVLERHHDFERNGFHWHLLLKGVDHLPYKEVIKPLWMSATHYNPQTGEGAEIAHIERIRNSKAIGYVTKYLTKSVTDGERGTRTVRVSRRQAVLQADPASREVGIEYVADPTGEMKVSFVWRDYQFQALRDGQEQVVEQEITEVKELVSKAHRICYSRQFFPERVADLRKRLFAGMEQAAQEQGEAASKPEEAGEDREAENEQRSGWQLVECKTVSAEEVSTYERELAGELLQEVARQEGIDVETEERLRREALSQAAHEARVWQWQRYQQRKRERLMEVLDDMNEGRCFLSRRVIGIWHYQRQQVKYTSFVA